MHPSITDYLAELTRKGRSAHTLKMVRQDLGAFVTWWQATTRRTYAPQLLRPEDGRHWAKARQGQGHAVSTINRGLTVLRGYATWLVRTDLLAASPMQEVADLPTQALAPRSLPPAAIDALLREVGSGEDPQLQLRDEAVVLLLIFAGLRVQEVCDLQLRDLDLPGAMLVIRSGKGGKARRVPLHPTAARVLKQYLSTVRCPSGMPRVGSAEEAAPLFGGKVVTAKGAPFALGLNQRTVQRLIRRLGAQAAMRLRRDAERMSDLAEQERLMDLARRLDTITPHMLRHSLAKRMLDRGAALTEVQRVLGHSRLDTTARYLTPSEDDLRAALLKAGI